MQVSIYSSGFSKCCYTLVALFFAAALPCSAVAQERGSFHIGIRAGIGMSSFQPVVKNDRDFYFSPTPDAGISLRYDLEDVLSINTGLSYTSVRTQRDGMLLFASTPLSARFPQNYCAYFTEHIRADYLELPLTIDGAIGGHNRIFCGAGIFLAARLSATNTTSGRSYIYADSSGIITEPVSSYQLQDLGSSNNITGNVRPLNFGGIGHIGTSCSLGRGQLGIDARCMLGAVDMWKRGARSGVSKTVLLCACAFYTIPCSLHHHPRQI